MKIAVKNFDNKQLREIDLPDTVFGYPLNLHLIHEAVQAYLAGLRSGTHKVKHRGEVSGSGSRIIVEAIEQRLIPVTHKPDLSLPRTIRVAQTRDNAA